MKVKEEVYTIKLDSYEHGVLITALNEFRNKCIEADEAVDFVSDVLLKVIQEPAKKVKIRA